MDNTEKISPQNLQIQGMIDKYLNLRSNAASSSILPDSHLDEDFLTAFVEGSLTRRESESTVKHLTNCSFCRHVTAELIKLEYAFNDQSQTVSTAQESEPTKISDVLSKILSRLFVTGDAAVFAHEEKSEDQEKPEDAKEEE